MTRVEHFAEGLRPVLGESDRHDEMAPAEINLSAVLQRDAGLHPVLLSENLFRELALARGGWRREGERHNQGQDITHRKSPVEKSERRNSNLRQYPRHRRRKRTAAR